MSKELQALEDIILYLNANEPNGLYCKNIEIIKAALKEHEVMKQTKFIVADAKISEEDLKKLINQRGFISNLQPCEIKPLFDEETQKKLKAFEIIKEKQVNVYNFVWYHEHHKWMTYEEYCKILDLPEEEGCDDTFELQQFCKWGERLTQEEYDLLKEVLL